METRALQTFRSLAWHAAPLYQHLPDSGDFYLKPLTQPSPRALFAKSVILQVIEIAKEIIPLYRGLV